MRECEQCSRTFFQTAKIIYQHYRYNLRQNCGNSFQTFKYKVLIIISAVEYFWNTRMFGWDYFYAWISPFKSHISLNRLYLDFKILNMTFCHKYESHTFAKNFHPQKAASGSFFTFLMSGDAELCQTLAMHGNFKM